MPKTPTIRQRRLAKGIADAIERGEIVSAGKLAKLSGYSKNIQEHPSVALEAEGTKQALQEYGFTLEGAKKVTAEILHDKRKRPADRLNAADKIFRVFGAYEDKSRTQVNIFSLSALLQQVEKEDI